MISEVSLGDLLNKSERLNVQAEIEHNFMRIECKVNSIFTVVENNGILFSNELS